MPHLVNEQNQQAGGRKGIKRRRRDGVSSSGTARGDWFLIKKNTRTTTIFTKIGKMLANISRDFIGWVTQSPATMLNKTFQLSTAFMSRHHHTTTSNTKFSPLSGREWVFPTVKDLQYFRDFIVALSQLTGLMDSHGRKQYLGVIW